MKRWILFLAILAVLSGCNGRTVVTTEFDLLSFLGSEPSVELPVLGAFEMFFPDGGGGYVAPDGGYLFDRFPLVEPLLGFGASAEIQLTNTGDGPVTFAASMRLAPASDEANIYDGIGDVELAGAETALAAGATQSVRLEGYLEQGDSRLELITNEGFRIGLRLYVSGEGSLELRLTGLTVTLEQRPFDLLVPDAP